MISGPNIKDRLMIFLQSEQITAGKLAESIGVQASAISHIMSGRNNPGYDFLYKLFSIYTRLNPSWMLLGKGEMYIDNVIVKPAEDNLNFEVPGQLAVKNTADEKSIEKIIVFYSNKTFDTYQK